MKILYLFMFSCLFSYSQVNILIVDYTYSTKFEELPTATTVDSRLISNGEFSNYEIDFVGNLNFIDEESGVEEGSVLAIRADENPHIFKDHKNKNIYSIERVIMKPFLVKDSMNFFNWKLHDIKKEILGYNCQKATVTYRGRNYTAYFTIDVPIKTGPWKFYGLPGLILQVESDDGVLKINANKIVVNKEAVTINNPYKNYKLKPISWQEYINEYEKKYFELKSYRSPEGGLITIPKMLIEELVKEKFVFTKD
jgi:GLPGLI family protein